ncbi:MAG: hypothetical protein H0T42_22850 [Deltaproteobacteria bacterium]|nr:hypothetical protein [Deltaproteobacteria bacterium]
MDLELREALALFEDREAALDQLLPGSEDHDYYRCLRAQHASKLDEAETIIKAWPERHGQSERYRRLQLRQLLLHVTSDTPRRATDKVRDWFGVSHWHEAEVETLDPTRPTRVAPDAFDGERLLQQASDHDTNLSQVTDEGLYELLDRDLDPTRRRVLLGRIGHTPHPALVELIARDLDAKQSGGFGSIAIHDQLTHEQLLALGALRPELRGHLGWVSAVVRRMTPPRASVDLELDREARHAYLLALWGFVAELPDAINTLKVHVLWHLLDTHRRLGVAPEHQLVTAYLQLPRAASYLPRDYLDRVRREHVAQLGSDLRSVTGLPPAGNDEQLVRDLIAGSLDGAEQFARWIDRKWLDAEIATARLLHGVGDPDRSTLTLGPAPAAALRERIELAWCPHNPTRFGIDDAVALDVDVKHVPELVVKVFRIDPLAYFQNQKREVGPDLDLDGLAASHEQVLRFTEPAVRRVRRRIALPMCARPGTYVIDLIGNGMSSRAVIHKGRLRQMMRIGPAGHSVTIVDEAGRVRPDARAWIGDREYIPDDKGAFVVPFSTAPGRTPALLWAGDLATVQDIVLYRETYQLATTILLDRQGLTAGRPARAIVRAELTNNGAPISAAAIKHPIWEVTLTDAQGVATTKSLPLVLDDNDAAILEWPMGDDTARVAIMVRGAVEVRSEQREQEVQDGRTFEVGAIHRTASIEALFLARTTAGFVISALGKSGEPRAQRSVTVGVTHRWSRMQLNLELATDEQGRIELGALPGISRITATLGGTTQSWWIEDHLGALGIQAAAGSDVVIPLSPSRTAAEVIRRMSLVETQSVPIRHPEVTLVALEDSIVIRGLRAGDYQLRAPGVVQVSITVLDVRVEHRNVAFSAHEVGELSRAAPSIVELTVTDGLRIKLRDPGARTRVHVLATKFISSLLALPHIGPRAVGRRTDRPRGAIYVSGRELGDEYRYILDRRSAKRYPGLLLDRPTLLLNPWSRRTTTTDVAHARAGGSFAPHAPRAQAYASGPEGRVGGTAGGGAEEAFTSYDFLGEPPAVLTNLAPDETGLVSIPLAELGGAACVTVVIDDPAGATVRFLSLPETPLAPRDLRLRIALDPARHATQNKEIQPLRPGDQLVIEDLATAKVHLVDSVERAHAYLLALRDEPLLRELAFVTKWHELTDHERSERYSKHACHELHLFLYFKDRPFFDAVVAPYLAHKRTKTFLDHWLIGADLTPYLEPGALARLNALERALLVRRIPAGDAIGRILGDQVAVLPPDPALDTRLIDGLIGASTLDADDTIASAQDYAYDFAEGAAAPMATPTAMLSAPGSGAASATPPPVPKSPRRMAAKTMQREETAKRGRARGDDLDALEADFEQANALAPAPMYRTVDRTQEWAENNWYHRTPAQSGADMIVPNRLWRDLALHRDGAFLSPGLGLATASFAEAMCALAVTDLPFSPAAHAITADGARLTIAAAGNALAGSSQLVDGELTSVGPPLVVGMSFVRADDRHEYVNGEHVDKYVEGPFATGIVYTCLVVLANPTSSRQRIAALVQIPRGSIPVSGSRTTQTIDVVLEPYGTHGHEYSFYFPASGSWGQFPVHVSRGGTIVAAAPGRTLEVVNGGAAPDSRSWPYLSQRAPIDDVVAFLETANLAAIDLTRIAWRMRERSPYATLIAVLEQRHAFDETLWGYALQHVDKPRIRVYLRSLAERLLGAGPVLDMVGLDAEDLGAYEHLEYSPLVNARAHRLGAKLRILNDGLAAQYTRFLDLLAHRRAPTPEDLLAATAYLLAQDRIEDGLRTLERVVPDGLADRMQYDYLVAYAACVTAELPRAREVASKWREHPVDRWRNRFGALLAMLDEIQGAAPAIVDARSREQQHAELAAKQPAFDLALDRDGIVIRSQHVGALELRFFEMDIELLFSRQPFVQSDVSRFSFIEPGHREQLAQLPPELRVAWPATLRGKNVVVEAVGVGMRVAKVHYANDLSVNVSHQVGQLRVSRASDHAALPATYVKVYARKQGGQVAFYKDGYTDLRGWFDYSTLSTNDLDHVERFAILVCSDQAGAAILEASPPAR